MSLFDRFKKKPDAENLPPEPVLTFQNVGHFDMAECPGVHALNLWRKWREEGKAAGFTVVLLGSKEDAKNLIENRQQYPPSPSEIIQEAAKLDVAEWIQDHQEANAEHLAEVLGEWPEEKPEVGSISAHLEGFSEKTPMKIVCLAKIPTSRSWEAYAYIGTGGWNDCPESTVQVALAKRWHEQYGAEVASITSDVMEFVVAKPPTTQEAAMILAQEHYAFCSDSVDQGHGEVAALAAALLDANYWYFWWD